MNTQKEAMSAVRKEARSLGYVVREADICLGGKKTYAAYDKNGERVSRYFTANCVKDCWNTYEFLYS